MRKPPYRPSNEITQSFNDGVAKFYEVANIARPGYKPVQGLSFKEKLFFETQRLGINRLYLSRQNQAEISMVIRVPKRDAISPQDIVMINDDKQYEIDSVQNVPEVYPPCIDVALKRIEQKYDIPQ